MSGPPTLFFDIGGVLLTDAWDVEARKRAAPAFGLDLEEFEAHHQAIRIAFATGRLSLADYLETAVFDRPRSFTRDEFRSYVFAQSQPLGETLAYVKTLAATGRHRFYTINNESKEIHEHRVQAFDLKAIFQGFVASCYLDLLKPDPAIYRIALGVAATNPEDALFIDDRSENVEAATALGMIAHHFQGVDGLREFLDHQGVTP